ncbi:MAG TPA: Asp23/Gls24 family envelope stress response protein [Candidatus Limnocylindrales bacterium]|nr:Asp23/Gls24 family envelope stress response protein [Candidatus Limnocylindrales bacterium]
MPTDEIRGRALATRRAATDITRTAVLGSYGVAGFEAGPVERVRAALVGRTPGIRITFSDDHLLIRLRLRVTAGLPIAEVARQVDSAVRYGIRRALGREVDELRIRIGGLEASPRSHPPSATRGADIGSSDLADSGTDVA